ncbi:hypothetical protein PINS_up021943 [Pythium insidiosum]|nr:hypothetical protein PINS_up021943 [Pythium insidiosum]
MLRSIGAAAALGVAKAGSAESSSSSSSSSSSNEAAAAPVCASAAFQALTPSRLGASPLLVRSLVQGDQICIEFSADAAGTASSAGWIAVGLSRSASMVNSPESNVMLLQRSVGRPESFVISSYSSSGVVKEPDQSFFTVHESSTATSSGPLRFSYQRSLAGGSQYDVPIRTDGGSVDVIWAFGTSWPISGHRSGTRGTETYNFATGASAATASEYCEEHNCPAIIGAVAFGAMLVGGVVVSLLLRRTGVGHVLLQKTLVGPPVKQTTNAPIASPVVMVLQNLADLKLGEVLVMLAFVGAIVVLVAMSSTASNQVTSGRVTLLILMFLILPVSRIPLWPELFRTSFERIVKFHRWLGMALSIATLVHLIQALSVVTATSSTKYGEVVPLYGFIAFLSFIGIGVTANEFVRRSFYEVFYFVHRVLSLVGFVFAILHVPKVVGPAVAVPLAFYGISLLMRWFRTMTMTQQATVSVNSHSMTTTLVLTSTEKTRKLAQTMRPCSYFWVRVPTVSGVQWHPFSAIVAPSGDSIGFCIRAGSKASSFTRQLYEVGTSAHSLAVNLCGPYGRISVELDEYDVVLLVAGGVGVTPLLSAVNQRRLGGPIVQVCVQGDGVARAVVGAFSRGSADGGSLDGDDASGESFAAAPAAAS